MSSSSKKWWKWLVKVLIVALCIGIISQRVDTQLLAKFSTRNLHYPSLYIPILLLLWVLNIWLEAKSWQLALSPILRLSIWSALADNLRFYTYGFISPGNMAGFIARTRRFATAEDRGRAIQSSAQVGYAKYAARALLAALAIIFLLPMALGLQILVALILLLLGLWLFVQLLFRLGRLPFGRWLKRLGYAESFNHKPISKKTYAQVLIVNVMRNAVYYSLFLFFLLLYGMPFSSGLILIIPFFYLASALLPTLPVTDLLVKAAVGLWLVPNFELHQAAFLLGTTSMWLINWTLPALVGNFVATVERH